MLKNYLVIALRNLRRQKVYSFINITGLAIGLAACLLVYLYIRFETSFDTYHEKRDRIYRLVEYGGFGEKQWNSYVAGDPIYVMRTTYTDVEDAVKPMRCGPDRISYEGEVYRDLRMLCTESNLFSIFSFDLVRGDPETVLDQPYTAVITRSLAEKLFKKEDPIGRSLPVHFFNEERPFTITGLMEDVPANTHFTFDLLLSYASLSNTRLCLDCGAPMYALLAPGARPEEIAGRVLSHVREVDGKEHVADIRLEPLSDIHFSEIDAERQGDQRFLYILSAIAVVMLLLACANYMNLATARYAQRTREVGVRKVLGAQRSQLMRQFLLETILLALLALPLALVLLIFALPLFNTLAHTRVGIDWQEIGALLPVTAGLLVLVGMLAGSYPAFFLSSSRPVVVLRGRIRTGLTVAVLRKGLVVFQFIVSITLIAFTIIILAQLRYMQQKKLGFDAEQVVLVRVTDPVLAQQPERLKQEFSRHPSVLKVSASSAAPGQERFSWAQYIETPEEEDGPAITFVNSGIDADFLETMEIPLVEGRNVADQYTPGQEREALLNEAAVRALGWTSAQEAIGRDIGGIRIVGVTADFHFASLHQEIGPVLMEQNPWNRANQVTLRIAGGDVGGTLEGLEQIWKRMGASQPFEYSFLTDEINQLYQQERHTAQAFGLFSGLAIFIACLGLFGLAAFAAESRTKEIGIRKVLGASVASIVSMLSKDFARLVFLAFLFATPATYFVMSRWLEQFAYRIDIGPGVFLVAGALVLLIALLTVSSQSARAAWTDPVKSLRYE